MATGGTSTVAGGMTATGGISVAGGKTVAGGTTSPGGTPAIEGGSLTGGTTSMGGVSSAGGGVAGASGSRDAGPDLPSDAGTGDTRGPEAGPDSTGQTDGGSNPQVKTTVWMAGDSTMAGGATTTCNACPCGWGSQFDPLFNSNVTVVNDAVGGLTIQTWLYQGVSSTADANGECPLSNTAFTSRWTDMLSATSGMKAGDYLIIQFGINDGDNSCPKHVGETKYEGYLNIMAQAAIARGVVPILLTPVSAIGCTGSIAIATRLAYFTTATDNAGKTNNVPVIDLAQLSLDLYNSLGLCPNSADYTSSTSKVGQFFCQDHTHFELAGAVQIAKVVAKALKEQGIGLGAYVLN